MAHGVPTLRRTKSMIKLVDQSKPFPVTRPNPKNGPVHRSVESMAEEHILSAIARVDRMAGFHAPRSVAWCELREAKQKLNDALTLVQKHRD